MQLPESGHAHTGLLQVGVCHVVLAVGMSLLITDPAKSEPFSCD